MVNSQNPFESIAALVPFWLLDSLTWADDKQPSGGSTDDVGVAVDGGDFPRPQLDEHKIRKYQSPGGGD